MSDLPPPPPDDSGWSSQPPPPRPESSGYGAAPAAGLAALGTGETVELATPGLRLGARLIDIVIGFVIGIIVGLVDPLLLPILAGAAYEVCFVALKGQTPGKMATSIKVVRADNGAFPRLGRRSRALDHSGRRIHTADHSRPARPRVAAVGRPPAGLARQGGEDARRQGLTMAPVTSLAPGGVV